MNHKIPNVLYFLVSILAIAVLCIITGLIYKFWLYVAIAFIVYGIIAFLYYVYKVLVVVGEIIVKALFILHIFEEVTKKPKKE